MKRFLKGAALLAISGLTLVSCSKDDDKGFSFSEEQVQGQWNFSKQRWAINGVWADEEDYDGNESASCPDYVTFNADHTTLQRDYWSSDCAYYSDYAADWSKAGNTIVIDEGDYTTTYNVVALSGTHLTVEESYSEGGVTYIDQYTFVKAN